MDAKRWGEGRGNDVRKRKKLKEDREGRGGGGRRVCQRKGEEESGGYCQRRKAEMLPENSRKIREYVL